MKIKKILLGAALDAATLVALVLSASAAIVCTGPVCWHTHEAYDYPSTTGVIVHPDDWCWGSHEHFVWREHEDRGYWRGGHWVGW